VKVDSSSVGSTDTPFNRTFTLRIVPEFDPESGNWFSTTVEPAGMVSATGYSDTPISFAFYEPALSVSVQPAKVVVGTATQVTVTAADGFTGASVSGSVRIGGQLVGTTGTPFSYSLSAGTAYGTVQATGYPSAPFSIQSVPPARLRVWTSPFPVSEAHQVQLTVHAVDDATNAPVSGAVLVDGKQVGMTNTPFSYTLTRPPPEYDPESGSWFTSLLPEGSVTAAGFPETAFRWN
jgi:hypothetical protein